jgi:hypothetical protein
VWSRSARRSRSEALGRSHFETIRCKKSYANSAADASDSRLVYVRQSSFLCVATKPSPAKPHLGRLAFSENATMFIKNKHVLMAQWIDLFWLKGASAPEAVFEGAKRLVEHRPLYEFNYEWAAFVAAVFECK